MRVWANLKKSIVPTDQNVDRPKGLILSVRYSAGMWSQFDGTITHSHIIVSSRSAGRSRAVVSIIIISKILLT